MPTDNLNPAYTDKLTYSINIWTRNNLLDLFSSTKPLFYRLRQNKNIKVGKLGPQIVVPVFYPSVVGPAVTAITDSWNKLTHVETGSVSAATYTPCELAMLVSASEYTMDLQNSETKMVDYVEGVMKINMKKFLEDMNARIWAAEGAAYAEGQSRASLGSIRCYVNAGISGTTTDGGATPPALPEMLVSGVGVTPKYAPGGIPRNVPGGAWWCSPIVNPGSSSAISAELINNVISAASNDSETPDMIIMPRKTYDKFLAVWQGYMRYGNGDSQLAKVGFNALKFRNSDVVFDDNCPTAITGNNVFALNTNNLFLHCKTMKPEFVRADPPDQFVWGWKARWVGQFVMDNPRNQGRLINIA